MSRNLGPTRGALAAAVLLVALPLGCGGESESTESTRGVASAPAEDPAASHTPTSDEVPPQEAEEAVGDGPTEDEASSDSDDGDDGDEDDDADEGDDGDEGDEEDAEATVPTAAPSATSCEINRQMEGDEWGASEDWRRDAQGRWVGSESFSDGEPDRVAWTYLTDGRIRFGIPDGDGGEDAVATISRAREGDAVVLTITSSYEGNETVVWRLTRTGARTVAIQRTGGEFESALACEHDAAGRLIRRRSLDEAGQPQRGEEAIDEWWRFDEAGGLVAQGAGSPDGAGLGSIERTADALILRGSQDFGDGPLATTDTYHGACRALAVPSCLSVSRTFPPGYDPFAD